MAGIGPSRPSAFQTLPHSGPYTFSNSVMEIWKPRWCSPQVVAPIDIQGPSWCLQEVVRMITAGKVQALGTILVTLVPIEHITLMSFRPPQSLILAMVELEQMEVTARRTYGNRYRRWYDILRIPRNAFERGKGKGRGRNIQSGLDWDTRTLGNRFSDLNRRARHGKNEQELNGTVNLTVVEKKRTHSEGSKQIRGFIESVRVWRSL
ncbi:hypothetical protein EI94DRAFT_1707656 [Lactarius quietus]|nr:hypothetical protein EI94DRAFT_1707656 [Lactarius quietus]